jgi:hypothetical protein
MGRRQEVSASIAKWNASQRHPVPATGSWSHAFSGGTILRSGVAVAADLAAAIGDEFVGTDLLAEALA